MDRDRLRKYAEVIGLIAVVASLLLVALEIRQANEIAVGTTSYEIVRDINEFNDLVISSPDFADLLIKLGDESPKLTATEDRRARAIALRLLNVWVAVETAHDHGLVSDEYISLTRDDVKAVSGELPGLNPKWRIALESQPEFMRFEVLQPLLGEIGSSVAPDTD